MRPSLHNVPAGQAPGKAGQGPAQEQTVVHRRVEITVEREIVSVLHQMPPGFTSLCIKCERDVLKLTPESAAAASGTTPREIYRWLDERKLHFEELADGQVFVCAESLRDLLQGTQRLPGETE
jgi:hypothetical protein